METSIFQSAYADQTTLHPLGLAVLLVCGFLTMLVPRRFALGPLAVVACFISPAQRLVILTLDFNLIRVMIVCGMLRIWLRNEWVLRPWSLDHAMLFWGVLSVLMPTFTNPSVPMAVNKAGYAFDAVGMYFMGRCLIRSWEDLFSLVTAFCIIAFPVAALFLVEKSTGRNLFAFLGGVPEITVVRNGRLRCQGAFAHAILAGCFWAGIMPLVAARWWNGWSLARVALALVPMATIVVLCASSTPIMSVVFILVAAVMFPFRRHMREFRWALLALVIFLHLIMNKPVWHLLARVDFVSGSTGWHRYHLVDAAIKHAGEWALTGSDRGTAHWGYGLEDVTNYYVVQGIHGGLLQLAVFIVIIGLAFGGVGRIWRAAGSDRGKVIAAWALGAALLTHVANFIAVSYFGQITAMWHITLAAIGSLAQARVYRRVAAPAAVRAVAAIRSPAGPSPVLR